MDSTPGPGNSEPDRPESAPPWVLVLVLVLFFLGMAWIMVSFGGGQAL
jgi:hypothetical protein